MCNMCGNLIIGLCWTKCSADCSITNEIFAHLEFFVLFWGYFVFVFVSDQVCIVAAANGGDALSQPTSGRHRLNIFHPVAYNHFAFSV